MTRLSALVEIIARKTDPANNKFLSITVTHCYISMLNPLLWYVRILLGKPGRKDLLVSINTALYQLANKGSAIRFNDADYLKSLEGIAGHGVYNIDWANELLRSFTRSRNVSQVEIHANQLLFASQIVTCWLSAGYMNIGRYYDRWLNQQMQQITPSQFRQQVMNQSNLSTLNHMVNHITHLPIKVHHQQGGDIDFGVELDEKHLSFTPLRQLTGGKIYEGHTERIQDMFESVKYPHTHHFSYDNITIENHTENKFVGATGVALTSVIFEIEDSGRAWRDNPKESDVFLPLDFSGQKTKIWVYCQGSQSQQRLHTEVDSKVMSYGDLLQFIATHITVEEALSPTEIENIIINVLATPNNLEKITAHVFSEYLHTS